MLNVITGLLGEGTPPVTNSYESIATVTVGSGGSSTITFSSIPSTYKHLQIRAIAREGSGGQGTANQQIVMRFNGDSGSNYSIHRLNGNGSATGADGYGAQGNATITGLAGDSIGANIFSGAVIDILDYQDTNKNKTVRGICGADYNGAGNLWYSSSAWYSTSAISSIILTCLSSRIYAQYSSFALYGIKG